jgi:hypothetical protein
MHAFVALVAKHAGNSFRVKVDDFGGCGGTQGLFAEATADQFCSF